MDQVLYEMPSILCLQVRSGVMYLSPAASCSRSFQLHSQEVMYHQLQDLDKMLGSQYDHVSAGREDGDKQGEVRH